MIPTPAASLEILCDKEFDLARNEAYENLDREVANLREHFGIRGLLRSSALGQSVLDAVLARYEKILDAFEQTYLGKWNGTKRELTESDHKWLRDKAMSVLQAEAQEAQTKCHTLLYEPSLFFLQCWQKAGPEAREKNNKIFKKIEILKLKKEQERASKPPSSNTQETKASARLPNGTTMSAFDSVAKIAKEWQPPALSTELAYRNSLAALLRQQLTKAKIETEYRHSGTTIDIYAKQPGLIGSSEVFIEMKRNFLQKAQLDRLVGQIESLNPGKNAIIVVLCGETNPVLVARFKEKYEICDSEFLVYGEPMTLILKPGDAKG